MELDHVFICVTRNAPEGNALKSFGLTEGAANRHPGQGTANRRFFFCNFFIELIYLDDIEEAQSALTKSTMLYERLSSQKEAASPFGICFRPAPNEGEGVPFRSWSYKPKYLPKELSVEVGEAPLSEPMWFYLSFASRPDQSPPEIQQPMEHPAGFRNVTALRMLLPDCDQLSEPAQIASLVAGLEIVKGEEYLLKIGFDDEVNGQSHDFRPRLPLIFSW